MTTKKKTVEYPKIVARNITRTRVYINEDESWIIGPPSDYDDDECDYDEETENYSMVLIEAPCGEKVRLTKEEYKLLRQVIDEYFKHQ